MTGGRRFSLSSPDWGQDHLSLDAIVAYVDDELRAGAHARAEAHLACCAECRAEVVSQLQARAALRTAAGPCLPSSLLRSLRSIPVEAELPPPPPGLGITADGQFVLLRDVPHAAESAAHPDGLHPDGRPRGDAGPGGGWRLSRRARVGAVSGLAIGALAVGALAAPGATPPAPGVFGGPVFTVPAQARLSAAQAVPAVSPAVVDRPAPAVAKPAVIDTPAGAPPAVDATDAVDTTSATPDSAGIIDARLRARLERSPVAFYRRP
jgi:Putative zinc-finger